MAGLISIGLFLVNTRTDRTFESLLSSLGVTTSLVEVVSGTNGGDGAADLESSGHVCWRVSVVGGVWCCCKGVEEGSVKLGQRWESEGDGVWSKKKSSTYYLGRWLGSWMPNKANRRGAS